MKKLIFVLTTIISLTLIFTSCSDEINSEQSNSNDIKETISQNTVLDKHLEEDIINNDRNEDRDKSIDWLIDSKYLTEDLEERKNNLLELFDFSKCNKSTITVINKKDSSIPNNGNDADYSDGYLYGITEDGQDVYFKDYGSNTAFYNNYSLYSDMYDLSAYTVGDKFIIYYNGDIPKNGDISSVDLVNIVPEYALADGKVSNKKLGEEKLEILYDDLYNNLYKNDNMNYTFMSIEEAIVDLLSELHINYSYFYKKELPNGKYYYTDDVISIFGRSNIVENQSKQYENFINFELIVFGHDVTILKDPIRTDIYYNSSELYNPSVITTPIYNLNIGVPSKTSQTTECNSYPLTDKISYSLQNFNLSKDISATFDLIINNDNNTAVLPLNAKVKLDSNSTLDCFFGNIDVIDDKIVVTNTQDIFVYDANTLEEIETDFNILETEKNISYLSKTITIKDNYLVFAFDGKAINMLLLDENFKIIKTEVIPTNGIAAIFQDPENTQYMRFDNISTIHDYVFFDYYGYFEDGEEYRESLIYTTNSEEILNQVTLSDYESTLPYIYYSNYAEYSADNNYILNYFNPFGGGDYYGKHVAVLDRKTGANTYIGEVGGSYTKNAWAGFFSNGDAYIMTNYSFKIFPKDLNFKESLNLANTMNLGEYTKNSQAYYKVIAGLRRDPYSYEFIVVYADVSYKSRVEVIKYNPSSKINIINTAARIAPGAKEVEFNYHVAYLDKNGNVQQDFEIERPVLLCSWGSFTDVNITLLNPTQAKISFVDLYKNTLASGTLDLQNKTYVESFTDTELIR